MNTKKTLDEYKQMIMEKILNEYKGYTVDFYECVKEKAKEMEINTAITLCERLYG